MSHWLKVDSSIPGIGTVLHIAMASVAAVSKGLSLHRSR